MSEVNTVKTVDNDSNDDVKIILTPQGLTFLIVCIFLGILGLHFRKPLLYFPGFVPPLVFIIFISKLSFSQDTDLDVEIILPSTQVKAKSFVTVEVEIRTNSSVRGVLSVETSEGLFPVIKPSHSYLVANREKQNDTFVFYAPRRGKEKINNVLFKFNGILGFFYAEKEILVNREIIILPEPQRIQLPWSMKQRIMNQWISQITIMLKGRGTEFLALKDFEYGDEIRHISWKATAKFGKLISKEFEEPMQLRFVIIVDGSLSMAGPKLEFALSSAVELATVIRRSEFSVSVLVHGEYTHKEIKIKSTSSGIRSLAIDLHNVFPLGTGMNYDSLVETIRTKKYTNSVVIILSDPELPSTYVSDGLIQLKKLSQRIFYLCCYTPGFGALAYTKIRDELMDNMNQYNYRYEIIEKKIVREYSKILKDLRKAVTGANSKIHVIESYETNILLELKQALDLENKLVQKSRSVMKFA